jgi:hypothetical protein
VFTFSAHARLGEYLNPTGLSLARDLCAAGEDAFGRAFGDQQSSLWCFDQNGGDLALVVERERSRVGQPELRSLAAIAAA